MSLQNDSCQRDAGLLTREESCHLLGNITEWVMDDNGKSISRTFRFPGYKSTMDFVNTVADIADQQDHHPDMLVSYNRCTVTYSTHSAGGLTKNDFICAARINAVAE